MSRTNKAKKLVAQPKYRPRQEPAKKGKRSYNRKNRERVGSEDS